MESEDVGIIPVCESRDTRRLVGCITDRDIVLRCVATGKDPSTCLAVDLLTDDLVTCSADEDIEEAERLMRDNQIRRILVVDADDALAGVLTIADLAREHDHAHVGATIGSISQRSGTPSGV